MDEIGEIMMDGVIEAATSMSTQKGGPWLPLGQYTALPDQIKVLLVEDDEADAYLVGMALENNPRVQSVMRAHDGVEALEMLEAGGVRPDLAIIDLSMPRMDGFALLRDIDQLEGADFPSIVLTSSRAGADCYRSHKRGARMFLSKPNAVGRYATMIGDAITELS
jgi:CheY-like chemotaxis protein